MIRIAIAQEGFCRHLRALFSGSRAPYAASQTLDNLLQINIDQKPKGLAWWRRTQAAPALARSLLSFAWFQPRSKVDLDGAFFFTPYPVCAAAGRTARAAPKLIAMTKILVTFISRNYRSHESYLARCARNRTLFGITATGCGSSG
jgi:hypothetical protein